MITSEKCLTLIIAILIAGSLVLTIKDDHLSTKFIDLTSTALGGYLALAVQRSKPVNSITQPRN